MLTRVAREVENGATSEDVLAAACIALLATGADAGDVHPILVIPSIHQLVARTDGIDRWVPVLWAAVNANLWCHKDARGSATQRDEALFSRDALERALESADAEGAQRLFRHCLRSLGAEAAAKELLLCGTPPREDLHAPIFAAQAVRLFPLLGPKDGEALLLSAVRFLARSPKRPPSADVATRSDSEADAWAAGDPVKHFVLMAINARVQDDSVSGLGVHRTTLLDALLFAVSRVDAADRGVVMQNAERWFSVRQSRAGGSRRRMLEEASLRIAENEDRFRKEHRARLTLHAEGEHDFKHFAAVETVADHLKEQERREWLATLALAYTADAKGSWNRWEQAASLSRRFRT